MHFITGNTNTIEYKFDTVYIFCRINFYKLKPKGSNFSRKRKGHLFRHILTHMKIMSKHTKFVAHTVLLCIQIHESLGAVVDRICSKNSCTEKTIGTSHHEEKITDWNSENEKQINGREFTLWHAYGTPNSNELNIV